MRISSTLQRFNTCNSLAPARPASTGLPSAVDPAAATPHVLTTAKQYGALILLLLFALCYYGSYYRCSLYPAGEGGLEGVTALRLLAGQIPMIDTKLNYNVLWFYPIVALFKIFGPSYTVLRIFFFFLATLTGLLAFYVVQLTTRRTAVAALAGLLVLILPGQLFRNYMAFLVMLNIALFLKAFLFSHQSHRRQLFWIGIAGLALSLTFLIRIDLGIFLSLIFFALALFFPWMSSDKEKITLFLARRFFLSLVALLLGIISFFVLHLPVYFYAQHHGFASQFVAQYQQWSHMIISESALLSKNLFCSSHPNASLRLITVPKQTPPQNSLPHPASSSCLPVQARTTLLRCSFFSSDLREKITALNLYLPLITSVLLLLVAVGFFIFQKSQCLFCQRTFQLLITQGCSLSLFPQYFFWRPDMVHLSEFMVPMTVTTIIGIVFAWEAWSFSKTFFKILLASFLLFGVVTLSLYLINGCQSQSTGGIAICEGRTKEFCGANGVHVKLKPHEWEEASAIYQSILHYSKPGEYVVCFPYNPEINFMTDRPSYRHDFYCDDATASKNFDQVAIREIEIFHPAVIVITNWPINGTEHSRFSNWATPTYNYIRSHYRLDYSKGIIQVFVRG